MCQLNRVAICAAFFGLLVTGPEAFSQQNPNKSKGADASTDMNAAQNASSSSYNWNGFYGGGNGGGGIGGADFLSAVGNGVPFIEGEFYQGFPDPATPGIIAAYRSHHADKPAVSIGVQAGYNYMVGGVLLGVEADVNYLNVDTSKTTYALGNSPFSPALYTFHNKLETNYVASLRPRVGFLVGDVLVYATGGVAMTTLNYEHDFRGTGDTYANFFGPPFVGPNIFEHASASRVVAGWTLGGGAELPILPNVSIRLEYLYTEFGKISTSENKIFPLAGGTADFACGADAAGAFPSVGAVLPRQCFSHQAELNLHRIRLGVNFKF